MSLLESELMKMGKGTADLSEMFIARYSRLRKIQRHLELKGSNFFTPGGQFHDAAWVDGYLAQPFCKGIREAGNNRTVKATTGAGR